MAVSKYARYVCPFLHHSVPKSQSCLIEVLSNLDDNRFRQFVRVNPKNVDAILNLIKDDDLIKAPRSCKQFSVKTQLIIILYRLGSSGEGGTIAKIATLFGVSDGGIISVRYCFVLLCIIL